MGRWDYDVPVCTSVIFVLTGRRIDAVSALAALAPLERAELLHEAWMVQELRVAAHDHG
jgi:hypothetical protein